MASSKSNLQVTTADRRGMPFGGQPERTLQIAIPRPLNAEINTATSFSLVQGFGKASDYLGHGLGGDRHLPTRIGLTLFSTYTNWFVTVNSHETAHAHDSLFERCYDNISFESFHSELFVPTIRVRGDCEKQEPPPVQRARQRGKTVVGISPYAYLIRTAAEGLNQQQRNAARIYQHNTEREGITYDEGIAYLMNQGADLAYFAAAPFMDDQFRMKNGTVSSDETDMARYEHAAFVQGIDVSRRQWVLGSLLTTAASGRTWESLWTIGRYLGHGERERSVNRLTLGETKFFCPDFRFYPYQGGFYTEGELPIKHPWLKEGTLYLRGGKDVAGDVMQHAGFALANWRPFGSRWYLPKFRLGTVLTHHSVDRVFVDPNDPGYHPPAQAPAEGNSHYPFVFSDEAKGSNAKTDPKRPAYPFVFSDQYQKKQNPRKKIADNEPLIRRWPRWEGWKHPHWGLALEGGLAFGPPSWQMGVRLLYLHDDAMENRITGLPEGWNLLAGTEITY